MASLSDASSIATLEAHCAGLPVVVTDHCGNREDIVRYDLGSVAVANSAESLAQCMTSVAFDFDDERFATGLLRFENDEQMRPYGKRVLELYRRLLYHAGNDPSVGGLAG
jgi:glycosyltransferase involved in cell wall biosynthesis